ncbi:MAG: hypothetical protein AB8B53_09480 [Flavobacteriales bacterium]
MRTLIFIFLVGALSSCGGYKEYTEQVQKLDSLLIEVNKAEKIFDELPHKEITSRLDSIKSTISFLKTSIGDEITFDDGLLLDDYRSTKSIVKKFGNRSAQIRVEFKRTQAQLKNFKKALGEGAAKDSNGEDITNEYVKENMKLEVSAAENLIRSVKELKERSARFIKVNEEKLLVLSPVIERFK